MTLVPYYDESSTTILTTNLVIFKLSTAVDVFMVVIHDKAYKLPF
jgi:hypothetical protein